MSEKHEYYGTARGLQPPPGLSHRGWREGAQRGDWPGHPLPGRGRGWIVSVAEWDAWVRAQQAAPTSTSEDSIEAAIRRRFKVAS